MAPTKRPLPTRVIFIRHGKTATTGKVLPGRAKGLHLSAEGQAQAERVAVALAETPIDAIYCSPLERTRETAAPLAQAKGLKTTIDKGLLEADFGDWTGATLAKLSQLPEWKVVQSQPSAFRFPGGESFIELQARIVGAIHRLVAAHPGQTIVAVSHADPIKAALNEAVGAHLDAFQRLVVSPCSASMVLYGELTTSVLSINQSGGEFADLTVS